MPKIVLFNKPFNVLTQFRADADRRDRQTLANFIHDSTLRVAGRLDLDSEGLLLLTDDGVLNSRITEPAEKQFKTYWVQVDGIANDAQIAALQSGVLLNDGLTLPAHAKPMPEPSVWPRTPPVRYRANLPTSWLEIQIAEGRNRQVRRMTAAIGLPTLRLIRVQIGPYKLGDLQPGETTILTKVTTL
jgi:23S rRNA pseudouridine2457 synthase